MEQREEGQGGKRIDRRMDRSRNIGAKHTHIHIHTIFILKNEDRIKSDDCRRESKPTSSEHMRRSIVNIEHAHVEPSPFPLVLRSRALRRAP